MDGCADNRACLYHKLTYETKGSGEFEKKQQKNKTKKLYMTSVIIALSESTFVLAVLKMTLMQFSLCIKMQKWYCLSFG